MEHWREKRASCFIRTNLLETITINLLYSCFCHEVKLSWTDLVMNWPSENVHLVFILIQTYVAFIALFSVLHNILWLFSGFCSQCKILGYCWDIKLIFCYRPENDFVVCRCVIQRLWELPSSCFSTTTYFGGMAVTCLVLPPVHMITWSSP